MPCFTPRPTAVHGWASRSGRMSGLPASPGRCDAGTQAATQAPMWNGSRKGWYLDRRAFPAKTSSGHHLSLTQQRPATQRMKDDDLRIRPLEIADLPRPSARRPRVVTLQDSFVVEFGCQRPAQTVAIAW